jgi:GDP-4-dehydro-6-deoxy-D-mannose reductase
VSAPVLVTGAGGFVGRHLLSELGDAAVASHADVTDGAALAAELRDAAPRAVVHLAAASSVADSFRDGAEVWRVNAVGTVTLLDAVAAAAPGARTLVVSTGEVYGPTPDRPAREDDPVAPLSPYAASKAAAELAAERAARAEGLDVVVARPFQHTGPGQDERFAIGSWTHQIARLERAGGGELEVGDLTVRRDLTDVRDVARAYRLLLDPAAPADTYNVASGRAVPLADVLATLVGLARAPVTVRENPARIRRVDLPVLAGDPGRLRSATGWEPGLNLERTLADALEAARAATEAEAT